MLTFFNASMFAIFIILVYWFGFNQGKEHGYGKGIREGYNQGFEQFRKRLLESLGENRGAILAGALRKARGEN